MDHQDWKPIIFTKKAATATRISTVQGSHKKAGSGKNTQPSTKNIKEDEFGMPITKGLPKDFGRKMQQARSAKNLTQKELAAKIGERVQVVKDYETGKVVNVSNGIVRKLERHLGKFK